MVTTLEVLMEKDNMQEQKGNVIRNGNQKQKEIKWQIKIIKMRWRMLSGSSGDST